MERERETEGQIEREREEQIERGPGIIFIEISSKRGPAGGGVVVAGADDDYRAAGRVCLVQYKALSTLYLLFHPYTYLVQYNVGRYVLVCMSCSV